MLLAPQQEDLLTLLVEAERNVPASQRRAFRLIRRLGQVNRLLSHPGLSERIEVFEPDVQLLTVAGLVHVTKRTEHETQFVITGDGHAYYAARHSSGDLQGVEVRIVTHISGDWFSAHYPRAHAKWKAANELLGRSDSDAEASTIGHLLREAMAEFAEVLVTRYALAADVNKAKTVARLVALIEHLRPAFGTKSTEFLKALIAYWGTISDLAQRLEHAVSRTGAPLIWEDSRRAVFQTAVVFFELDRACRHQRPVA